jgi:hypothetical protein
MRGVITPHHGPSGTVPEKLAERRVVDRCDFPKAKPREAESVKQRGADYASMGNDRYRLPRVTAAQAIKPFDDTQGKGRESFATPPGEILAGSDTPPFFGEAFLDLVPAEPCPPPDLDLAPDRIDDKLCLQSLCELPRRVMRSPQIARIDHADGSALRSQMVGQPRGLRKSLHAQRYVRVPLPAAVAIPGRLAVADEQQACHSEGATLRRGGATNQASARRSTRAAALARKTPIVELARDSYDGPDKP